MRTLIQRVSSASVTIDGKVKSEIGWGLLVFVGIEDDDDMDDIEWLCNKISKLRVFDDEDGVPNRSVKDIDGELLVVSQFTLHASTKKGSRPSYMAAAKPEIAIPMYERFVKVLSISAGRTIKTGEFGADMKVQLVNDGPITLWIDSKVKE